MKKSILALVLAIIMVFSMGTVTMAATKIVVGENLVENGDLETLDASGNPVAINARNGWGGPQVSVETSQVHSGKTAAKLDGNDPAVYTYLSSQIKDLIPGAKYEASFWYKGTVAANVGLGFQIEQYSNNILSAETAEATTYGPKLYNSEDWTHAVAEFVLVETANMVHLVCGFYPGNGLIYMDDLSLVMVEAPPQFKIESDVFYYTDWETGTADVEMHELYEDEGYTVNFDLRDGKKSLKTDIARFDDNKATFEFDLSLLAEKKKAYTIYATITNKNDKVISEITEEIYRYDRPTNMTKDGQFLDENGEVFYPVIGCSWIPGDHWEEAIANGINVFAWVFKASVEESLADLDRIHAMGAKVAAVCFWDMYPAGNERNLERVGNAIKDVMHHPAIFCWSVADEPFSHNPNVAEELRAGYKMIHDIDDVHPIYLTEAIGIKYGESAKYTDILGIDPYPGNGYDYATHVGDMSAIAVKGTEYKKPVMNYQQSWDWVQPITDVEFHSGIYQGYLGGCQMLGFYGQEADPPYEHFFKDEIYKVMVDFKANEYDVMNRHFSLGKSRTVLNETKEDNYWYEIWPDGNDIYVAVQNRTHSDYKVNVPLQSKNGRIVIDDFEMSKISSLDVVSLDKNGSSVEVTLRPKQAALIKVTPAQLPDYSLMTAYADMESYPWAMDAVKRLDEAGIIEFGEDNAYRPSENITRGEFAAMLIRTIGLKSDKASKYNSFADVDPKADYALEIAIGKEYGVLKGVSATEFNPEAEISRQDLMVICVRGMNMVRYPESENNIGVDGFSDKGSIADYALENITTMVNLGIIKGNADGTINPLGNTTRAEAAVIMSRILDWK